MFTESLSPVASSYAEHHGRRGQVSQEGSRTLQTVLPSSIKA